jgi:hypothetical protein
MVTNDQVTTPTAGGSSCHGAGQDSPGWLSGRRGLVVGVAVAAAAIALELSQHWLSVAELVPLLVVLPCAVMMFTCMKGMNRGQQADTAQTSLQNGAATLPAPQVKATEPIR